MLATHAGRVKANFPIRITSYAQNAINSQAANLKQGTEQTTKGKSASLLTHASVSCGADHDSCGPIMARCCTPSIARLTNGAPSSWEIMEVRCGDGFEEALACPATLLVMFTSSRLPIESPIGQSRNRIT